MEEVKDNCISPTDITMTPEMIEKYKKLIEQEEKKNAYNREYMRKLRMDKEKINKIQREYRQRKKLKEYQKEVCE